LSESSISIVIADASTLSCQLLSRGLGRRHGKFEVCACAVDAAGAIKEITHRKPAVALIAASLQDGPRAGFKVLRELCTSHTPTQAVMLLDGADNSAPLEAFASGAKGVLFRSDGFELVCKCLACVHAGQVWANTAQMQLILDALAERGPLSVLDAKGRALLTGRQEEIVRMVAEGMTNTQISKALRVSAHTVKNHLFRIYEKLGVSNRVELILYAFSGARAGREPPSVAA